MKKKLYIKESYLKFLDELRESGKTNMFGSPAYLRREFPELTQREAREVVVHWTEVFPERQKNSD